CGDTSSYTSQLNYISLKKQNAVKAVEVYPNPATDKLRLSWQPGQIDLSEVRLYDATGKLLRSEHITEKREGKVQMEIDVSSLRSGAYSLQLKGKRILMNQLILIQRP
ncbi:MAG: T9SS type A sorting domain-containing protein, partial [Owenweeksia sp.]